MKLEKKMKEFDKLFTPTVESVEGKIKDNFEKIRSKWFDIVYIEKPNGYKLTNKYGYGLYSNYEKLTEFIFYKNW